MEQLRRAGRAASDRDGCWTCINGGDRRSEIGQSFTHLPPPPPLPLRSPLPPPPVPAAPWLSSPFQLHRYRQGGGRGSDARFGDPPSPPAGRPPQSGPCTSYPAHRPASQLVKSARWAVVLYDRPPRPYLHAWLDSGDRQIDIIDKLPHGALSGLGSGIKTSFLTDPPAIIAATYGRYYG